MELCLIQQRFLLICRWQWAQSWSTLSHCHFLKVRSFLRLQVFLAVFKIHLKKIKWPKLFSKLLQLLISQWQKDQYHPSGSARCKVSTSADEAFSKVATVWSVSTLSGRAASVSQQLGIYPVTCRAVSLTTTQPKPNCSFGHAFRNSSCKSKLFSFVYDESRVSISAKRGATPIQVPVSLTLALWRRHSFI